MDRQRRSQWKSSVLLTLYPVTNYLYPTNLGRLESPEVPACSVQRHCSAALGMRREWRANSHRPELVNNCTPYMLAVRFLEDSLYTLLCLTKSLCQFANLAAPGWSSVKAWNRAMNLD